MWHHILIIALTSSTASTHSTFFNDDQIIFTSEHPISRILVPVNGPGTSETPTIFFTILDNRLESGSAIYALEGFAAFEILEGGRDTTSDYSFDPTIYFAAKDGLYKYDSTSISAKRFGVFRDDFIQLQKANGTDVIYALDSMRKLYKIENEGTVKTKVENVDCVTDFVLDPSNNLYFVSCNDDIIHIIRANDSFYSFSQGVLEDHKHMKLIRPASFMIDYIPYLADGSLYILHENGKAEKKDFYLDKTPSALSVDSPFYIAAALNGKIYDFNVMDAMINSIFIDKNKHEKDISKMVMSVMDLQA